MLAGLERRDRHLGVEGVRRRDRHDVDLGIGDKRPPVAGRPGKAELPGARLRQSGVGLGEVHEPRRGPSPKTGATAFQASAWHLPM